MYLELDDFYFLAYDVEIKAIEILKYIQPFSGKLVKGEREINTSWENIIREN